MDRDYIRYRHLRAATVVRDSRELSEWDLTNDQDRTAYAFSWSGELSESGPGGYANLYLLGSVEIRPNGTERYREMCELVCARCATEFLRADSCNAVTPHCAINGWSEREGEACGDCGEWIIPPMKDAVILRTDDDDYQGTLVTLTNGGDVYAEAHDGRYAEWFLACHIRRYPDAHLEIREWCDLEELAAEYGDIVWSLYGRMPY
jgi:hypothetical protein